MPYRTLLVTACFVVSATLSFSGPVPNGSYVATAYSVTGITASGEWTHRHVVAADPDVIPIGSRIKIRRAGRYSGEYVVADTGAKIQGRKLDIYMPNTDECKKFGARRVRVRIIQLGDGTRETTKEADKTVKQEVQKDMAKGVVGNAATASDWSTKKVAEVKTAAESGKLPAQPPQQADSQSQAPPAQAQPPAQTVPAQQPQPQQKSPPQL